MGFPKSAFINCGRKTLYFVLNQTCRCKIGFIFLDFDNECQYLKIIQVSFWHAGATLLDPVPFLPQSTVSRILNNILNSCSGFLPSRQHTVAGFGHFQSWNWQGLACVLWSRSTDLLRLDAVSVAIFSPHHNVQFCPCCYFVECNAYIGCSNVLYDGGLFFLIFSKEAK